MQCENMHIKPSEYLIGIVKTVRRRDCFSDRGVGSVGWWFEPGLQSKRVSAASFCAQEQFSPRCRRPPQATAAFCTGILT